MVTKQLLLEQEAVDDVREMINSVLGKRWMIAVWCMDQAEQNSEPVLMSLASRTTWHFPHGCFEESLRLLRENLDMELQASEPPVPAPLEMAPFILHKDDVDTNDEELGGLAIPKKDEPPMTPMSDFNPDLSR